MKSNWGCKKKAKCFLWLFAWNSGTIQNLNIINANIDCDRVSYIGGIACVNEGNINHVRLMALLV